MAEKSGKVEFLSGYAIKEIKGKDNVECIVILDINGDMVLDVGGVFIEIGAIPNVEFAKDVVKLNEVKEKFWQKRDKNKKWGVGYKTYGSYTFFGVINQLTLYLRNVRKFLDSISPSV